MNKRESTRVTDRPICYCLSCESHVSLLSHQSCHFLSLVSVAASVGSHSHCDADQRLSDLVASHRTLVRSLCHFSYTRSLSLSRVIHSSSHRLRYSVRLILLQWFRVNFSSVSLSSSVPLVRSFVMSDSSHQPSQSPRGSLSAPADESAQLRGQLQLLYTQLQQQAQQQAALEQQVALQLQQRAASPVRHSESQHGPKLRTPPTFRGEGNASSVVDDWISEMIQQFDYYRTSDAEKVRLAVANFQGPAATWWRTEPALIISEASGSLWKEFLLRLYARYRPIHAAQTARRHLDLLRQKAGQSVNTYCNSFQTILTAIDDMSQADQVHHFINGLQPALMTKVMEKHVTTLRDAIDAAVSLEGIIGFARHSGGGTAGNSSAYTGYRGQFGSSTASANTSSPMEISHVATSDDEGNGESDSVGTAAAATGTVPSMDVFLSRIGAMMDQRINALSQGSSSSSHKPWIRNSNRVPGMKPGEIDRLMREHKCFRCKQPGHFKNECPQAQSISKNLK
jgi:hypothetical protein